MDRVEKIDKLIGRPVVSFETANNLGHVTDLLIDPVAGKLTGVVIKRGTEHDEALVSNRDVHGIGPDAVVVEGDHALVMTDASPLKESPRAKADLIGVKVMTEQGQLLGSIASLFLCHDERPVFIYEVRSSILDKLLGRAVYFAAALGCAFSEDRSALVISGEPGRMDNCVEAASERLLGDHKSSISRSRPVHVEVRSHAH